MGAILVFAATVIGPVVLLAIRDAVFALRFGWHLPSIAWLTYRRSGDPFGAAAAVLAILLFVGARELVARGRDDGISGELGTATWLAALANAATFLLIAITLAGEDRIASSFFEDSSGWTLHIAEALLALVASRHFARVGRDRTATASRWLAAALPAAGVAEYLLKRTRHDDMGSVLPPLHASLVLPMDIALWVGKLVLFGLLCLALTKGAKKKVSHARAPESSRRRRG